jgi:hypothetical protein
LRKQRAIERIDVSRGGREPYRGKRAAKGAEGHKGAMGRRGNLAP